MAVFSPPRAGSAPEASANNQYLGSSRQEDDKALEVGRVWAGFCVLVFLWQSS